MTKTSKPSVLPSKQHDWLGAWIFTEPWQKEAVAPLARERLGGSRVLQYDLGRLRVNAQSHGAQWAKPEADEALVLDG